MENPRISFFIFSVLIVLIPAKINATSGGCSWHDGVDCARGMQSDGRVYCNDGWTESMTYYEYTAKCQNDTAMGDPNAMFWKQLRYDGKIVSSINDFDSNRNILIQNCPQNSSKKVDYSDGGYYCVCNEGYYNYEANNLALPNQTCTEGEPFVHMVILARKASDKIIDGANRTSSQCRVRYLNSFLNEKGDCDCKTGYRWVYDVYEERVFCIKRDDYEAVIINNAPDPLENVESVDKTEEVDYTAYGNIPEDEEIDKAEQVKHEDSKDMLSAEATGKEQSIPIGTEKNNNANIVETANTASTGNVAVGGMVIIGAMGYLYYKMKKK